MFWFGVFFFFGFCVCVFVWCIWLRFFFSFIFWRDVNSQRFLNDTIHTKCLYFWSTNVLELSSRSFGMKSGAEEDKHELPEKRCKKWWECCAFNPLLRLQYRCLEIVGKLTAEIWGASYDSLVPSLPLTATILRHRLLLSSPLMWLLYYIYDISQLNARQVVIIIVNAWSIVCIL